MKIKNIYLKRGKTESLRRYHPWIFSGAIAKIEPGIIEGDLVNVIDENGNIVAVGHYQIGSIAVRILSFKPSTIDTTFWEQKISAAYEVRKRLGLVNKEKNNIFRLIHGEGDGLPGLIVDIYGKTAVVQAHSVGMHHCRNVIAEALMKIGDGLLESVYYKSETTLPFKAALNPKDGYLVGNSSDSVAIENSLSFYIDWLEGQKTGFFIDQRENRALLEKYAKDKTVLNMFCYTGGFSVYAMRGGAQLVHSVDCSAKAIALTERNIELNYPNDTRHEAYTEDAFKFLEKAGNQYNLIVLDPPAFAKHKDALQSALKGYTRLNAIAFEKIQPGGIIFTFSCSQAVSPQQFRLAVFTAAAKSGRHVRILHQLHQPADHPICIYHPEGEYLKGLVLSVD
jgi:23S rRNA (cytosine1962-C5)-methyltransferase